MECIVCMGRVCDHIKAFSISPFARSKSELICTGGLQGRHGLCTSTCICWGECRSINRACPAIKWMAVPVIHKYKNQLKKLQKYMYMQVGMSKSTQTSVCGDNNSQYASLQLIVKQRGLSDKVSYTVCVYSLLCRLSGRIRRTSWTECWMTIRKGLKRWLSSSLTIPPRQQSVRTKKPPYRSIWKSWRARRPTASTLMKASTERRYVCEAWKRPHLKRASCFVKPVRSIPVCDHIPYIWLYM